MYLSVRLSLAIALVLGAVEGFLAAVAYSGRWPDSGFLPVEVLAGLAVGCAWGGTLGATVVAIRMLLYLGQDLPGLTRR